MGVNVSRSADVTMPKEVGNIDKWYIVANEYTSHCVSKVVIANFAQPILLDDITKMLCYIRWPNQSAKLVDAHKIHVPYIVTFSEHLAVDFLLFPLCFEHFPNRSR